MSGSTSVPPRSSPTHPSGTGSTPAPRSTPPEAGAGAAGPGIGRASAVGALCGLAWAGALRAYMAELNSELSTVTWSGTFVGILLPGVIAGAALGAATAIPATSRGRRALRWCAAAPLTFAVVPMLLPGQLAALLTTGLGGGAVGVALGGLAGGYALGGRRLGGRLAAAAVWLVLAAGVTATVPIVGGSSLVASSPRGLWVMLLVASLMGILALAASVPFRRLRAA